MARYQIVTQMMAVPRAMAIAEADTPSDAVRKAREFAKQGRSDLQIGDVDAALYYPVDEFAAKHGIR